MKLQSSDSFKCSHLFHNNRSKLRRMEWFIAVFFVVSLLIGSGVFIKSSNASNLKVKNNSGISLSDSGIIPGSMRTSYTSDDPETDERSVTQSFENDTSCELKKEL